MAEASKKRKVPMRVTAKVKVSRKEYTYEALSPGEKAYVATTLAFLDMESTPARRDALAALMFKGAWREAIDTLKAEIDSGGVEVRGT